MANKAYENIVLQNKLTDILNTGVDARAIATVDLQLAEEAGMKKRVNVYAYSGEVEALNKGEGNSKTGAVTFTSKDYVAKVYQQKFSYQDEDFMTDPMILDAGIKGSAQVMINSLNDEVFAEFYKATNVVEYEGALSYDAIVDAIATLNIEDENGLFLVIGTDKKAEVRKDPDFKSARQGEILFNGQIGDIAGVPVIVSKLATGKNSVLATKEAVTIFLKKDSEVETDRDSDSRTNDIFLRRVGIVALVEQNAIALLKEKEVIGG